MKALVAGLWAEENGQDLAEYALLLAMLALGAIASIHTIANTVNSIFQNAATTFRLRLADEVLGASAAAWRD
jgi:Flp pilus assembly pilin Flp